MYDKAIITLILVVDLYSAYLTHKREIRLERGRIARKASKVLRRLGLVG